MQSKDLLVSPVLSRSRRVRGLPSFDLVFLAGLPFFARAHPASSRPVGLPPNALGRGPKGREPVHRGVGGVRRGEDGDFQDHSQVSTWLGCTHGFDRCKQRQWHHIRSSWWPCAKTTNCRLVANTLGSTLFYGTVCGEIRLMVEKSVRALKCVREVKGVCLFLCRLSVLFLVSRPDLSQYLRIDETRLELNFRLKCV